MIGTAWALISKAITSPWVWMALLAAGMALQTARLSGAKDDVAERDALIKDWRRSGEECATANEHSQKVIAELKAVITEMAQTAALQAEQATIAIAERERQVATATASATTEKRKRDELWKATRSCEGLGSMRVDVACDDVAHRLQERTASH